MGLYSLYLYHTTKEKLTEELQTNAQITLTALQQNLSHLIEAYAVNEYQMLIAHEIDQKNISVIVVDDDNMAKILGEKNFYSGKIRSSEHKILDFNPNNKKDFQLLKECYYPLQTDIFSSSKAKIGTLYLCSNDKDIKKELSSLMIKNIFIASLITLLLILSLFTALRRFVLRPIANIMEVISRHDDAGIPTSKVNEYTSAEFNQLSKTINRMIEAVQEFRTQSEEQQKQLALSESRFRELFEEHSSVMLLIEPQSGKIVGANAAAAEFYGYSQETLINMNIAQMHTLSEAEIKIRRLEALKHKQNFFTFIHRLADGSTRDVEVHATPIKTPTQTVLFSIINDITDKVKAEKELKQSVALNELLFNTIPDLLWLKDANGIYLTCNKRFEDFFGAKKEEIIGKTDYDFVNKEMGDFFRENDKKAMYAGKPTINEEWITMANDSSSLLLETTKAPLVYKDGTVAGIMGIGHDITLIRRHQEALEHSAKHDPLTSLPNRFLFNELIQNALYRVQRSNKKVSLFYIDLDGFKEINDIYGHDAGDAVLVELAKRMLHIVRKEDVVARLGGDEFVIALADIDHKEDVIPLLQRLLQDINMPITYLNDSTYQLSVSASIGVSFYPQNQEVGPEALLRQADQAMYEAKNSGKNQYRFFNIDADQSFKERQQSIEKFIKAIDTDELVLNFQPKVDMVQNKVLGFEALLRWKNPEKGLLPPDAFLPLVNSEKSVMLKLGRWVFEHAFSQLSLWNKKGHRFTLGINISAHEFNEVTTLELLADLLKRHSIIDPSQIELEILETHALEDSPQAHEMIKKCQALGFSIALDDFGTGYSTLSYLKELPVDTLKIDKSFVMEMLDDSGSFSIIEAAMGLAKAFRCKVVAEGVESEELGNMLIQLDCTVAQGYAISKPLSAKEVEKWLLQWESFESWSKQKRLKYKGSTVLMALVEHRQWMRMLKRYLNDSDAPKPELHESKCRFGIWLQEDAQKECADIDAELFTTLLQLHHDIHGLAIQAVKNKDASKWDSIETIHKKILIELDKLIAVC